MTDYKSILENLGYKLTDRGSFWHTNAVYRGGDNFTAIQVYKDSGVWKDFVQNTEFMPFEALVGVTLNTKDNLKIREVLKNRTYSGFTHIKQKQLLSEEKTYHESCLKKLLPHYDFYLKKGISKSTLKDYKCGLASGGKLYQRIVFPTFNKEGKICGFSGRKVSEKNDMPKWIHLGKKNTWFYPYYSNNAVRESIEEKKEVFIVESIGDSLSLYEAGVKNNLVSFGTSLSPKFVAALNLLDVDRIYVSLNNDFDLDRNRGFEGALSGICKLVETVDLNKIYFVPPTKSDFGQMNKIEIEAFLQEAQAINHQLSISNIIAFGKERMASSKQSKALQGAFKNLCKLYNFNYG